MLELDRVIHNLTNHPPKSNGVVDDFENIRVAAKHFASGIFKYCPESRERSLAITALEETVMWAVAAIARNQGVD